MKHETITERALYELSRCLQSLLDYQADPGGRVHSQAHAAAYRASLDASKALAVWRKAPKPNKDGMCK